MSERWSRWARRLRWRSKRRKKRIWTTWRRKSVKGQRLAEEATPVCEGENLEASLREEDEKTPNATSGPEDKEEKMTRGQVVASLGFKEEVVEDVLKKHDWPSFEDSSAMKGRKKLVVEVENKQDDQVPAAERSPPSARKAKKRWSALFKD
jgi:hypothetical protein